MFENKIKLFKLLGFQVSIDFTWIILAVLIAWSLSTGFFPFKYKDLSIQTYWFMGIIGALGLFLSIIAHEFSHSLVARRYGMPMKGITLFLFGGVAEMGEEPPSARAEFMMAIAGPISSIIIAFFFYAIYITSKGGLPQPVNGVILYLAMINGILAAFNLIPAFPLDGGRVLRSILWGVKKNFDWSTKVSSHIGSAFGLFLIFIGVLNVLTGNFIGGMWWFLIGMFLRGAAKASYRKQLTRRELEGESVSRFMKMDPITVPESIFIEEIVNDYIYKYHFKMFPVVKRDDNDKLLGCITTRQIKEVPREEWQTKTVGEIAEDCTPENSVKEETDAADALEKMNKTGSSRLLVLNGDKLVGIVTLKDMLKFLSLKMDFEES
jgi:Zn-dependent protease/predicted transcriptional regulator